MNDFERDLGWSETVDQWWEKLIGRHFIAYQSMENVAGPSEVQRRGVDKWVTTGKGRLGVEVKTRRNREPIDVLLEYVHHPKGDKPSWPGWINRQDSLTDILGYGFFKYKVALLCPYKKLQALWMANSSQWSLCYGSCVAENHDYWTISAVVPIKVLLAAQIGAKMVSCDNKP